MDPIRSSPSAGRCAADLNSPGTEGVPPVRGAYEENRARLSSLRTQIRRSTSQRLAAMIRGYDTPQLFREGILVRMRRLADEVQELLRRIPCPNCSREIPWAMRRCPHCRQLVNMEKILDICSQVRYGIVVTATKRDIVQKLVGDAGKMVSANTSIDELIEKLRALPRDWSPYGSLAGEVLRAIAYHCSKMDIGHSLETGCGKSTLLFSHLSRQHKVFAMDADKNGNLKKVQNSPFLNSISVEFIEGPAQRTLPQHRFDHRIEAALIDGPHGYPFPELDYYFIYPLLKPGGILIVDDIQIPTIRNMFNFLKTDEMFSLIEVVRNTAFFRRTERPTFDPYGDGWWSQNYNKQRDRISELVAYFTWVPKPIKRSIRNTIYPIIKRLE